MQTKYTHKKRHLRFPFSKSRLGSSFPQIKQKRKQLKRREFLLFDKTIPNPLPPTHTHTPQRIDVNISLSYFTNTQHSYNTFLLIIMVVRTLNANEKCMFLTFVSFVFLLLFRREVILLRVYIENRN